MPLYKVSYKGTLLVNAESLYRAEMFASMWGASVKQMTKGVEIQPCSEIEAVFIEVSTRSTRDITEEYISKKSELQKDEEEDKSPLKGLAQKLTNYYVGEQMWYELFEKPMTEDRTISYIKAVLGEKDWAEINKNGNLERRLRDANFVAVKDLGRLLKLTKEKLIEPNADSAKIVSTIIFLEKAIRIEKEQDTWRREVIEKSYGREIERDFNVWMVDTN
jgi:hypothetical protein